MSTITTRINSEPSIYIHRVFHSVTQKKVFDVFSDLFGYDAIDSVDVVNKFAPNGDEYKRVFVHFRKWPNTYESHIVRERLISGETIKIVYDEPWFWQCAASTVPRPDKKQPYIDINNNVLTTIPQTVTPTRRNLGYAHDEQPRVPGAPRKRLDYAKKHFDSDSTSNSEMPTTTSVNNNDSYDDVMKRAMDARTKTNTEDDEKTREMLAICKRLIDESYVQPKTPASSPN